MGLAGKKCNIFYKDSEQIKKRVAVIVEESIAFLTIKNEFGTEAIPNCNIIRVEVLN
jgi:hypothetical protein